MDEPADPDGLGEEVTDTVGTARVLAAPRTPTKTEREEHDVSHVPYRRDNDRPRVFADYG